MRRMKRRIFRRRHLRPVPDGTLPAYLRPPAPTAATVLILAPRAVEGADRPSAA